MLMIIVLIFSLSSQNYLKEFNQLLEEFKQLNVTIFGVCAQEQADVDKAVQSWELNYSVSNPQAILHACTDV